MEPGLLTLYVSPNHVHLQTQININFYLLCFYAIVTEYELLPNIAWITHANNNNKTQLLLLRCSSVFFFFLFVLLLLLFRCCCCCCCCCCCVCLLLLFPSFSFPSLLCRLFCVYMLKCIKLNEKERKKERKKKKAVLLLPCCKSDLLNNRA